MFLKVRLVSSINGCKDKEMTQVTEKKRDLLVY